MPPCAETNTSCEHVVLELKNCTAALTENSFSMGELETAGVVVTDGDFVLVTDATLVIAAVPECDAVMVSDDDAEADTNGVPD
jgi:hypothetical protein